MISLLLPLLLSSTTQSKQANAANTSNYMSLNNNSNDDNDDDDDYYYHNQNYDKANSSLIHAEKSPGVLDVYEHAVKLVCSAVNGLNTTDEQCQFLATNDCFDQDAVVDYVRVVYCQFGLQLRVLAVLLLLLLLLVYFCTLGIIADEFLCPNLLALSKAMKMSDSLAGITLLAFGNGCTDIFSSLIAASNNRFELMIGELLGAGIFCTSIIIGFIFIYLEFELYRYAILRDTLFYLLAVSLTTYYCFRQQVSLLNSLSFIMIYILYIVVALFPKLLKKYRQHSSRDGKESVVDTIEQPLASILSAQSHLRKPSIKLTPREQLAVVGESRHQQLAAAGVDVDVDASDDAVFDHYFKLRRCSISGNKYNNRKKSILSLASLNLSGLTPSQQQQQPQLSSRKSSIVAALEENKAAKRQFRLQEKQRLSMINIKYEQDLVTSKNSIDNNEIKMLEPSETNTTKHLEHSNYSTVSTEKSPKVQIVLDQDSSINQDDDAKHCSTANTQQVNRLLTNNNKQVRKASFQLSKNELIFISRDDNDNERLKNAGCVNETKDISDDIDNDNEDKNNEVSFASLPIAQKILQIVKAPLYYIAVLTIPVVDLEDHCNGWHRKLNLSHCLIVPIMLIFLTRILKDINIIESRYYIMLLFGCTTLASFVSLALVANYSRDKQEPRFHIVFACLGFAMSIMWIFRLSTEIISVLKVIGIVFGLSDSIIGLAVLALGNSLGDVVANMSLASAGYPRMALGAAVGSPLMNLLIGFGVSVTINLFSQQQQQQSDTTNNHSLLTRFASIENSKTNFLLCSTLITILVVLILFALLPERHRQSRRLKRWAGVLLIAIYLVYFATAMLFESGIDFSTMSFN